MSDDQRIVYLSQSAAALLRRLRTLLQMDTIMEVIQTALCTLRALVYADRRGWKILVVTGDDQVFEYSIHQPNTLKRYTGRLPHRMEVGAKKGNVIHLHTRHLECSPEDAK